MNMSNWKVGVRLGAAFAAVLGLVLVLAATGLRSLNGIGQTTHTLVTDVAAKVDAASVITETTRDNSARTVRALAQRSAEAAREIKGMITHSVERVDAGSRIVRDAGSSMQDIVRQVQRVAMLISEISSAARQQSSGLDQVNQAMAQMDQATQQNAALVEESASAAERRRSAESARRRETVRARFGLLTAREREVLELLSIGQRTKDIALTLSISAKTVEEHRKNLMRKTRTSSMLELVRVAAQAEILSDSGVVSPS